MNALRVIADDLTGACDVGAELLPWPGGVAVASLAASERVRGVAPDALWVCNTQSRTLDGARAAARVTAALRGLPARWPGIVLKKIDTGLRGALGAEVDAAMDALGVGEAFVLPAIPEVGRTTEGGRQMIGGVPVEQTAFARDPRNPIHESRVAAVIESTGRRRAAAIGLADVRDPGRLGPVVDGLRASGASVLVCDAQTAEDIESAVRGLVRRTRPLLLVGSTGLAHALRRVLAVEQEVGPRRALGEMRGDGGILCVVGSAHPASRAQVEHATERERIEPVVVTGETAAEMVGQRVAAILRGGRTVALVTTTAVDPQAGARLRAAALATLARARPSGLVLVGGETAYDVLDGLDHPPLWIASRLCPLVVRGRLLSGAHAGLGVITKGGSSGSADLLGMIVRHLARGGR